MTVHDADELRALAARLRDALALRVVIGGGAPGPVERDVWRVGAVDHDWLFPRCAAIVHHGGAGTSATAAHAGVPSVVCPLLADQFFWADRVVATGTGVRVRGAPLDETGLLDGVARALTPEMGAAARALAARAGSADGLAAALATLHRALASSSSI